MRSSFSLPAGLASALLALPFPGRAGRAARDRFPRPACVSHAGAEHGEPAFDGHVDHSGRVRHARRARTGRTDADDFWLVSEDCLSFVLASPSTCTAKLRFIPSRAGSSHRHAALPKRPHLRCDAARYRRFAADRVPGSARHERDRRRERRRRDQRHQWREQQGRCEGRRGRLRQGRRARQDQGRLQGRLARLRRRIACQFNHRAGRNSLVQLHDSRGARPRAAMARRRWCSSPRASRAARCTPS